MNDVQILEVPTPPDHFNASAVLYQGKRITAFRIDRPPWCSGRSEIVISDGYAMRSLGTGMEDPRLFLDDGLCCSYCTSEQLCLMGVMELEDDFRIKSNRLYKCSEHPEKNWTFFANDAGRFCIYTHDPQYVVLKVINRKLKEVVSATGIYWAFGQIRGGTPPVLVDGKYFTFFHSSVHARRQKRCVGPYYIGCMEFDPDPPFAIISHTKLPLVVPDEERLLAMFPGGAILDGRTWHIICGRNNEACCELVMPHDYVLSKMETFA